MARAAREAVYSPRMLRRFWANAVFALFATTTLVVAAPACSQTAAIVDIRMALDEEGWAQRDVFFTDTEKIYCVGRMGVGRPGVVVEMRIRQYQVYNFVTNELLDADGIAAYERDEPDRSEDWQFVSLEITPKSPTEGEGGESVPFPRGRFECEMYVDGVLQGTAPFIIDFPPCPESTIVPETMCFGFYTEGSVCPKYGALSRFPRTCKCTAADGWACQPG